MVLQWSAELERIFTVNADLTFMAHGISMALSLLRTSIMLLEPGSFKANLWSMVVTVFAHAVISWISAHERLKLMYCIFSKNLAPLVIRHPLPNYGK